MSEWRIVSNTAGAILHPQPAPWEYCVNLIDDMPVISAKVKSKYGIWLKMKKAAFDYAAFLPPKCYVKY